MQAQAEHRARYPDWRFRPGTNVDALAKRKTKDKNKDRPPARRRRTTTSARDKIAAATGGGGGGGGSGAVRNKARGVMQERRCAQIAELLARGVKGVALTSAVQAWDKESGVSPATDGVFVAEPGVAATKTARVRARAKTDPQVVPVQDDARGRSEMRSAKDAEVASAKTRSVSSVQQARFNVALTSMFRRASSVPLAPAHDSPVQSTGVWAGNTLVSNVPEFSPPPLSPASSVSYCSESSYPDSDNSSVGVFLLVLSVQTAYFIFCFFSLRFLPCTISCPSRRQVARVAPTWTTTRARSARLRVLPGSVSVRPVQRRSCKVSSRTTRRSATGQAALHPQTI